MKPASFVRMFKPRFAPKVKDGSKGQTVRPYPKRRPKPGDKISLREWVGKPYRSKQRVLRESVVTEVRDIILTAESVFLYEMPSGAGYAPGEVAFAKADGFNDWQDLVAWFKAEHGLPFKGILIKWEVR